MTQLCHPSLWLAFQLPFSPTAWIKHSQYKAGSSVAAAISQDSAKGWTEKAAAPAAQFWFLTSWNLHIPPATAWVHQVLQLPPASSNVLRLVGWLATANCPHCRWPVRELTGMREFKGIQVGQQDCGDHSKSQHWASEPTGFPRHNELWERKTSSPPPQHLILVPVPQYMIPVTCLPLPKSLLPQFPPFYIRWWH